MDTVMELQQQVEYNEAMSKPVRITLEKLPDDYFSQLCKEIRAEEAPCSQREMAEWLDVAKSTYESWEAGKAKPHSEALVNLLKIRANRRRMNLKAILP